MFIQVLFENDLNFILLKNTKEKFELCDLCQIYIVVVRPAIASHSSKDTER